MLETQKPPASPRIRPADISRRPEHAPRRPATARSSGVATAARPRSLGNTALRSPAVAAPRPTPAARPNRLGRSEMRLMGLATASTAVVCGLLLLYLAAYAHVTQLGIDQADARGQLRRCQLQNEMLQAERNRLQSPQRVIAAAIAAGMTVRGSTQVEYVSTSSLPVNNGGVGRLESVGSLADQEIHGGTTADGSTAASFDH